MTSVPFRVSGFSHSRGVILPSFAEGGRPFLRRSRRLIGAIQPEFDCAVACYSLVAFLALDWYWSFGSHLNEQFSLPSLQCRSPLRPQHQTYWLISLPFLHLSAGSVPNLRLSLNVRSSLPTL